MFLPCDFSLMLEYNLPFAPQMTFYNFLLSLLRPSLFFFPIQDKQMNKDDFVQFASFCYNDPLLFLILFLLLSSKVEKMSLGQKIYGIW